ncbi:MAG: Por secretion system C-terminal sorting protein [Verrucomicrobia bacterium]|nr:Por secretion system C-terminal sorting protein [Verrucomicrobiota bacterium]
MPCSASRRLATRHAHFESLRLVGITAALWITTGLFAANTPPLANAAGPYFMTAGGTVVLNAARSNDPDAGDVPASASWDVNGDGVYGDLTGMTPTLVWAAFPVSVGIHIISVKVTDTHGAESTATASLTVMPSARTSPSGHMSVFNVFSGYLDVALNPAAPLTTASDGKIYGTTLPSGNEPGTVFRVNPDGTGFVVLHKFPLSQLPGALLEGGDGKLYGLTTGGAGSLFSITSVGTYQLIYSGQAATGTNPVGGIILRAARKIYAVKNPGRTKSAGINNSISSNGVVATVYDFNAATDGANPTGGVAFGSDGRLYGTTQTGGPSSFGTIYAVAASGTGFTVLRAMAASSDGWASTGPMTLGKDTLLYGLFSRGGSFDQGVFYSLNTTGTFTVIANFGAFGDGLGPQGSPILAANGKLYGVTRGGGTWMRGQFFNFTTAGVYSISHAFEPQADGSYPAAGLATGPASNLIGTLSQDGPYNLGALFSISTEGAFSILHALTGFRAGQRPLAGLIQASDGWLYGATAYGGLYGLGTVYRLKLDGSGHTVLHSFDGANDGSAPRARLLQARDGRLYGSAEYGGLQQAGTLFRLNLDGTGFTVLRALTAATDGANPQGTLMQAADGMIYGTTSERLHSSVFRLNSDGTGFTRLFSTSGVVCHAGLVQADDGRLFGMTANSIFSLTSTGTNFTTVRDFNGGYDGGEPFGELVKGRDGKLYGITSDGGTGRGGTVFSLALSNLAVEVVHPLVTSIEGGYSQCALSLGADGNLYGVTSVGGPAENGTLFSVTPAGVLTVLDTFASPIQGNGPSGTPLQATNGLVYGTTAYLGLEENVGTIFAYAPNHPPVVAISASTVTPMTGESVQFTSQSPADPDGDDVSFAWNFGDGSPFATSAAPTHAFSTPGNYSVTLQVTDTSGATSNATKILVVSATAPSSPVYFGTIGVGGQFGLFLQGSGRATMIGYLPNGRGSFIAPCTIASDGSFSATLSLGTGGGSSPLNAGSLPKPGATALVVNGRIDGTVLTGMIASTGDTFSGASQPATGSTAVIAGLYEAPILNAAEGAITLVVGTNGTVIAAKTDANGTQAAVGTVAADGQFLVQLGGGVVLQGKFAASTHSLSGQVATNGTATNSFGGINASVTHTDRLVNISTRGLVGDGEKMMLAGFVITGSQSKSVLVRATGPTLRSFGLGGGMENPVLKIFRATDQILMNDDWGTSADAMLLTSTAIRVGAFAQEAASKDSSLVATLPPGVYSAQVSRAPGSATGLALVEVYDSGANPGTEEQRLVNISTRGEVGTGEGIMIAGFVISGNVPKQVLIRGVGPTLANYGVGGVLANPQVKLYQGETTLIASNDDWETGGSGSLIALAAAEVGGFPLAAGSKDSALLITLAPGIYSAQVSGVNSTTGIVLLEVYEVP